jgi:hypothetical protein
MAKHLTPSQILGEIGEAAARLQFLSIGFQFDGRSRLEAGIDAIAEVMDDGRPMARMIAVQVKARHTGAYVSETDNGFSYLLRRDDLDYWRGSNLPVIIVLYRRSDETFFWQEVPNGFTEGERQLQFVKSRDILNRDAVDRLAALTVPKAGFGYYVPPLGGGEEALVNILPLIMPSEMFVATTLYTGKAATAVLLDADEPARFDWVIRGSEFWSFHDPRTSCCRQIVDLDQVEAIDSETLASHEDIDEQNTFIYLLSNTLKHQVREDLNWSKTRKLLYFRALQADTPRTLHYDASKKRTEADVVNVSVSKSDETRVVFVRHHAFIPRFEQLAGQWYLIITPTYYFTTNGFIPHSHPAALLAGKKRMDNSASLRGQVIMWYRFLTRAQSTAPGLFLQEPLAETHLRFGEPPTITLSTRVPEDVWGTPKRKVNEPTAQESLVL